MNKEIDNIINSNIKELKKMLKVSKKDKKYSEWKYTNLRVTRLERVFFNILAQRMIKNKTQLLRRVIHVLMKRYPKVLEEAKYMIDNNLDEE